MLWLVEGRGVPLCRECFVKVLSRLDLRGHGSLQGLVRGCRGEEGLNGGKWPRLWEWSSEKVSFFLFVGSSVMMCNEKRESTKEGVKVERDGEAGDYH